MEHLTDEPIDFTVTRLPYFLRPELPGLDQSLLEGGKWTPKDSPTIWGDQMDGYTRKNPQKFGGEGQPPDARFGIGWQAAEVGLRFVFSQPMSNSMDALRLLMKVQDEESPAVREKLFEVISRKYFSEGQPLADHDMLLEAAQEAGVPTAGLREWLATSERRQICRDLLRLGLHLCASNFGELRRGGPMRPRLPELGRLPQGFPTPPRRALAQQVSRGEAANLGKACGSL